MTATNALATRPTDDSAVSALSTEELVVVIKQEHELVEEAASSTLSHALRCGLALLEVQKRVPPGQWMDWMAENLQITHTCAERYMRIAFYKEQVLSSGLTGIKAAYTYLKPLPQVRKRPANAHPDELKKEAKRLRAEGLTLSAIGELLGVSSVSVHGWVNPRAAKHYRQQQSAKRAKARAARAALRQKERAEATKRAGGKIDKAYSLLRKCLSETDAALADATDHDRRVVLRSVIRHLQRAEEEMGKV